MQNLMTVGEFNLVYNAFSFTLAVMFAATVFLFLGRSQVAAPYRTAVTISGIVTMIAAYHYFRIFNSWDGAYKVTGDAIASSGGARFNDAYRYVDWLLTVPLLLVELVLVMRLSAAETVSKAVRLSVLAALMILLGYPGEIAGAGGPIGGSMAGFNTTRLVFWVLSMIPFVLIVLELVSGLNKSLASQPTSVRGLVNGARWLTIISWSFYPIVYLLPLIGLQGATATVGVQVGYAISDIVSKVGLGLLIYAISARKSEIETTQPTMVPVVAN